VEIGSNYLTWGSVEAVKFIWKVRSSSYNEFLNHQWRLKGKSN
jgi:hypothetical protein